MHIRMAIIVSLWAEASRARYYNDNIRTNVYNNNNHNRIMVIRIHAHTHTAAVTHNISFNERICLKRAGTTQNTHTHACIIYNIT